MSTQLHEHFNDIMLTPTERHFLKLLNEGKTPQDITDLLGLSRLSVDFHFKKYYSKIQNLDGNYGIANKFFIAWI